MTNKEAIEHLKELKTLRIEFPNVLQEEALDLAIKALEERPQADALRNYAFEVYQGNGVELETLMVVPLREIDNAETYNQVGQI